VDNKTSNRTKDGMKLESKMIVVMPGYNAATTLGRTVKDIPRGFEDEIILIDDSSRDEMVAVAQGLGLTTIPHDENKSYGANQKTCYDDFTEASFNEI